MLSSTFSGGTGSNPVKRPVGSGHPAVSIPFREPSAQAVNIAGTNFNPTPSSNIVFFGAVQATVATASATNLTITVPAGSSYAPITEMVNGLTAWSGQPFLPTFVGNGQIDTGTLAARVDLPSINGVGVTIIADLDGDGKADVVVCCGNHLVSIYRNISTNGSFDRRIIRSTRGFVFWAAAATASRLPMWTETANSICFVIRRQQRESSGGAEESLFSRKHHHQFVCRTSELFCRFQSAEYCRAGSGWGRQTGDCHRQLGGQHGVGLAKHWLGGQYLHQFPLRRP